jgi:hypothetical protein
VSAPRSRHELCRALAALAGPSPDPEVCRLLELPAPPGPAAHTDVFVLETHPYASVHLGAEGMIGGEAGDRVAGFWRALGAVPPPDADHLATLLELYAALGQAETAGVREPATGRRRAALMSARAALVWEHLASWVPVHLASVERVGEPFHQAWATITAEVLAGEVEACAPPRAELPTALALAPPPLDVASRRGCVDALLAPVRAGMVVTRADLVQAGADLGLGVRRGERRFTLEALLDQDASGVLGWLSRLAADWVELHERWHAGPLGGVGQWWAARARATATILEEAASAKAA